MQTKNSYKVQLLHWIDGFQPNSIVWDYKISKKDKDYDILFSERSTWVHRTMKDSTTLTELFTYEE